jgi:hypothetical protein
VDEGPTAEEADRGEASHHGYWGLTYCIMGQQ